MQSEIRIIKAGVKLRSKQNDLLYLVKSIHGNDVLLASEDGGSLVLASVDLVFPEYEQLYD